MSSSTPGGREGSEGPMLVSVITVGNEVVNGDIANTNGRWLARALARLGLRVAAIVAVVDESEAIADVVRWASARNDFVVVTGGLGATPDDVTRDGIAQAFGVDCQTDAILCGHLRKAGGHMSEFAAEWSRLPVGSRLLESIHGGAPAFSLGNVYALAGQPSEMRASFKALRDDLRCGEADVVWRRTYPTAEHRIASLLRTIAKTFPDVSVGSYAHYTTRGPEVELVVRASDPEKLSGAAAAIEANFSTSGVARHPATFNSPS